MDAVQHVAIANHHRGRLAYGAERAQQVGIISVKLAVVLQSIHLTVDLDPVVSLVNPAAINRKRGAGYPGIETTAAITVAAIDNGKVIIATSEHPDVAEESDAVHVAVDDQTASAATVEIDQGRADFTAF